MSSIYLNTKNQAVVKLTQEEIDSFLEKAQEKSKKYSEISPDSTSPYGFNHVHSHHVGMLAEFAVHEFFNWVQEQSGIALNIEPVYMDSTRDGEADIILNGTRIDVKCMSKYSWTQFGPRISARQYNNLCKKAEVILWVRYITARKTYTIMGFNYMRDVKEITPLTFFNPESGQSIENYPVLAIMHNTELLTSSAHAKMMKDIEPPKGTRKHKSFYAGLTSSPKKVQV